MANLGSDVSQLFSHLEKGETSLVTSAFGRTERVIAELLAHPELQGGTGEVETLRNVIADTLSEKRNLEVTKDELEEYFFPFSMRVLYKAP